MGQIAFIAYSIAQTDAHMVEELGDLVASQGFTAEYDYPNPAHALRQHAFDQIAVSGLFVGLITAGTKAQQVLQLWQYARSQNVPAVVLLLEGVSVLGSVARHPDIITFKRFMPENPVRFIELWMTHH
jgi:hypothetical protein